MTSSSLVIRSQRVILDGQFMVIRPHKSTSKIRSSRRCCRSRTAIIATEERIDLGDQLISPAFINAHTHLSMGMFRGLSQPDQLQTNVVESLYFRVEQHLEPADISLHSNGRLRESLGRDGCVWITIVA